MQSTTQMCRPQGNLVTISTARGYKAPLHCSDHKGVLSLNLSRHMVHCMGVDSSGGPCASERAEGFADGIPGASAQSAPAEGAEAEQRLRRSAVQLRQVPD